jgi:uncharacterized membrane protein
MARPGTSEVTRLEGFSDAVFALSATFLVVSLEVPQTFTELIADLAAFPAFALCFLTLVLIWSVHHAFFRRYHLDDTLTIVLNGALLFVVLFYVYPLKFVSRGLVETLLGVAHRQGEHSMLRGPGDLSVIFILYGCGFAALFLLVALLYRHAIRRREALELTRLQVEEARFLARHYLIFTGMGLLSALLAWSGIGLLIGFPGWVYALLGPLCFWHGKANASRLRPEG